MRYDALSIGVRLKRRKKDGLMVGRHAEVYDLATGKLLPALHASIDISPDEFVTVTVRMDVEYLEVVDED